MNNQSHAGLLLSAALGIAGVALLVYGFASWADSAPVASSAIPAPIVNVWLPTVAPTATATTTATPMPTATATVDALSRFVVCGTATPGALCVVPAGPAPTPTPYPSCDPAPGSPTPASGKLCRWTA